MPVINNGMKSCNNHRGDGLHLASAFTVTVVSQDVGDAPSQSCGVRSLGCIYINTTCECGHTYKCNKPAGGDL